MSIKYATSLAPARAMYETNDCSVKALSIAADIPYRKAHALLDKAGRLCRQGARQRQIHTAFDEAGYKLELINHTAKTVSTITQDCLPDRSYICYVHGHVLAIRGGKVEDWTEGRRHRVMSLYRVTPKQSKNARRKAKRYASE